MLEMDHAHVVSLLKKTNVEGVFEWRRRTPEGALRLIFSWGKGGLWCIGAFVKHDDREGDRLLRSYSDRAKVAKSSPLPR
jgi:hypothetical protein